MASLKRFVYIIASVLALAACDYRDGAFGPDNIARARRLDGAYKAVVGGDNSRRRGENLGRALLHSKASRR
jgi:hypothetical protein